MPKQQPSPSGLNFHAHLHREGTVKKGADGNLWIVRADKNGRKSWKREKRSLSRVFKVTPRKKTESQWKGTNREGYRIRVEYAPTSRSTCKECGEKILQGQVRMSKLAPNPFDSEGGTSDYAQSFHLEHGFISLLRSRCATKVPASTSQIIGLTKMKPLDKSRVIKSMHAFVKARNANCVSK